MEKTDKYDVLLKMMGNLREDMKDIKEGQKQINELFNLIKILKDENQELRTSMSKLEKRIDEIERKNDERYEIVQRKMSHQEQSVRKNNIIIKGLETSDTTVTQDVKIMIERKLNLKTEIKEAVRLDTKGKKEIILVKLNNNEDKQKIMKSKKQLKGNNVYIEDDLPREERRIQYELRKAAKELRETGKTVRVGFQKLIINGRCHYWDKTLDKIAITKN